MVVAVVTIAEVSLKLNFLHFQPVTPSGGGLEVVN